jgi:hypothetical protein
MAGGLLFAPVVLVKIGLAAAAPVQRQPGADCPWCCRRWIRALMGAKPVPLASRIKGLVLSSRRKKLPKGPSMRRMSRSFISLKTWSVNLAARQMAQVQFDGRRIAQLVRRIGHAVAAPRTIAQDELDILAGVVLQNLVGGNCRRSTATSGAARAGPAHAPASSGPGIHPPPARCGPRPCSRFAGWRSRSAPVPALLRRPTGALSWWAPCCTRPASRRLLQEPQAPSRQP